jgi:RNA polymerase sigma-70 factor (sigma-E family)
VDFSDYVTSNGRALERYAFVLSGDRQRAQDLVQTALLKVCRHWRRVSVMEFPDAYVRRIITTSYLDWRRRRSNAEVPLDDRMAAARLVDESNPAHRVVERDALHRALRTLSPHQRAVLVLRYYEGLDDEAIAAHLGCGVGTVRTHASRGLARLRGALHPADPADPADHPAHEPVDGLADRLEES